MKVIWGTIRLITMIAFGFQTGCRTIYVTKTWKTDTKPVAFRKIAVSAVVDKAEEPFPSLIEATIAKELDKLGYSTRCYNGINPLISDTSASPLKADTIDAVIMIVFRIKVTERTYIPAYIRELFSGYYESTNTLNYDYGYNSEMKEYLWEVGMYDMHSGQLIYSAKVQSFEPLSTAARTNAFAKLIVRKIIKAKVTTQPGIHKTSVNSYGF